MKKIIALCLVVCLLAGCLVGCDLLNRELQPEDEYGPWSAWSTEKVSPTRNREVQTQQRYRYREKETTTGSAATKEGWVLYDTTYGSGKYGSWSQWSEKAVSSGGNIQVETITQYSYREKEYTTAETDTLKGWTLENSTYGAWGKTQTTTSKPKESDVLRITDTKQTAWGYQHWCNYYKNELNNWNIDSIKYGGIESHQHFCTTTFALPKFSFPDKGGQTAYGGTGSGASACAFNFYVWFRNPGADVYTYSYQTRSVTYNFWKWADNWSEWSNAEISGSDSREIKTRTLYRYRTCEQPPTYHFWRWGSWSEWSKEAVSATEDREVEETTFYRYRERRPKEIQEIKITVPENEQGYTYNGEGLLLNQSKDEIQSMSSDKIKTDYLDPAYYYFNLFIGKYSYASVDQNRERTINGKAGYHKVTDKENMYYNDFINNAKCYFSAELIKTFESYGFVANVDGMLYVLPGGYGGPYDPGYPQEYNIESCSENKIVYCRCSKFPKDPWTNKSLDELTEEDYNTSYIYYTMEKIGNTWLFTAWEENTKEILIQN